MSSLERTFVTADYNQRDKIKRLALSLGELAVRHVDVLLQLIEEEYLDRINDIKELHPKSVLGPDLPSVY